MLTACRRLKSPQSLSCTSAHPTMVTLINIMVMNGWLTSFSFHVNRPSLSWDKAFQTLTLKFQLQGQGHGCGQRARSYNQPSIILTHFVFISHQSDQQFLRWSYFEIWLWNIQGQAWVRSKVKVTYCTQYPTNAFPFCFTSIGTNIPEIWPK